MAIVDKIHDLTKKMTGLDGQGSDITASINDLTTKWTQVNGAGGNINEAITTLGRNATGGMTPTGTIEITENGENIDVSRYAKANVNVAGGGSGDISLAQVKYHFVYSNIQAGATTWGYATKFPCVQNGDVALLYDSADIDVTQSDIGESFEATIPMIICGDSRTLPEQEYEWIPLLRDADINIEVFPIVTGNAELDSQFNLVVRGDCTINIAINVLSAV